MVRERFLATCAKPLEIFLRERALADLDALAKAAKQFEATHGSKPPQPVYNFIPASNHAAMERKSPIRRSPMF